MLESTNKCRYIFLFASSHCVGAVGLISIHLAFYQMNPWPTALSRILNLWNPHEFDSGRISFVFAFYSAFHRNPYSTASKHFATHLKYILVKYGSIMVRDWPEDTFGVAFANDC